MNTAPSRDVILTTERTIRCFIRRTPVLAASASDFELGDVSLFFKLELCQHAGSFKTRGAFANLLMRQVPAAGVVAASGGNHGVAVAYAARTLGVAAKIFVPTISSPAKIEAIRSLGADLAVTGDRYADALAASEEWAAASGALPVHAFNQYETLAGQGTLAAEFDEQVAGLDTVLVAVGGGGLIGGVCCWFREQIERNAIRIIGVEPESAPTLTYALRAGRPVDAPAGGIAADSLAPRRIGEVVFPVVRSHVHSVVLVADDAIASAQKELWRRLRIVAEPGAAAPFAALLSGGYKPRPRERIGVVISGGNTDAVQFGPGPSVGLG